MDALRVWLIHRLGGIDKPKPPKVYCLKRGAVPFYSTTLTNGAQIAGSTFTGAGALTFMCCACPDCKKDVA